MKVFEVHFKGYVLVEAETAEEAMQWDICSDNEIDFDMRNTGVRLVEDLDY